MSGYKNDLNTLQAEALKTFQGRLETDITPLREDGKSIILWGVELVPNAPKVDVILLKFLRAREFKVEEAATMLINCIKWRKEFGIERIFEEKYPEDITDLGFIHKTDKDGRPVMYNIYGNVKPKEVFEDNGGIDKFVRWRVQLMEKAILRLDMEKIEDMVIVHDYNNVSLLSMDKNTKLASKTLIALFQDNYPELLARKFFVNIPWFFESVFNVLTALASQRTKEKFVVCSKSSLREKLLVNVPVENLPTAYGGLSQLDRHLASSLNVQNTSPTHSFHSFTSQEKASDVNIEQGAKHTVEKEVEVGDTLVWEFTAFNNDLQFSINFIPSLSSLSSTETSTTTTTTTETTNTNNNNENKNNENNNNNKNNKDNKVVIEANRKLEQHAGVHVATEKGKYVVVWDNEKTFFGKRQRLFYKVFVVTVSQAESAQTTNVTNEIVD